MDGAPELTIKHPPRRNNGKKERQQVSRARSSNRQATSELPATRPRRTGTGTIDIAHFLVHNYLFPIASFSRQAASQLVVDSSVEQLMTTIRQKLLQVVQNSGRTRSLRSFPLHAAHFRLEAISFSPRNFTPHCVSGSDAPDIAYIWQLFTLVQPRTLYRSLVKQICSMRYKPPHVHQFVFF